MRTLRDKQFLVDNLCWFYRLMVASAPLLEFAIKHCPDNYLKEFYAKHLAEEQGHDEMLAKDLVGMGIDRIPCSMSAARLAGSQYYLIAHHHPAMLLGYMQALESESLPVSLIEELEATHGCELACLRHHAIHDPHHIAELDIQVVGLPEVLLKDVISNRDMTILAINAEVTLWRGETHG